MAESSSSSSSSSSAKNVVNSELAANNLLHTLMQSVVNFDLETTCEAISKFGNAVAQFKQEQDVYLPDDNSELGYKAVPPHVALVHVLNHYVSSLPSPKTELVMILSLVHVTGLQLQHGKYVLGAPKQSPSVQSFLSKGPAELGKFSYRTALQELNKFIPHENKSTAEKLRATAYTFSHHAINAFRNNKARFTIRYAFGALSAILTMISLWYVAVGWSVVGAVGTCYAYLGEIKTAFREYIVNSVIARYIKKIPYFVWGLLAVTGFGLGYAIVKKFKGEKRPVNQSSDKNTRLEAAMLVLVGAIAALGAFFSKNPSALNMISKYIQFSKFGGVVSTLIGTNDCCSRRCAYYSSRARSMCAKCATEVAADLISAQSPDDSFVCKKPKQSYTALVKQCWDSQEENGNMTIPIWYTKLKPLQQSLLRDIGGLNADTDYWAVNGSVNGDTFYVQLVNKNNARDLGKLSLEHICVPYSSTASDKPGLGHGPDRKAFEDSDTESESSDVTSTHSSSSEMLDGEDCSDDDEHESAEVSRYLGSDETFGPPKPRVSQEEALEFEDNRIKLLFRNALYICKTPEERERVLYEQALQDMKDGIKEHEDFHYHIAPYVDFMAGCYDYELHRRLGKLLPPPVEYNGLSPMQPGVLTDMRRQVLTNSRGHEARPSTVVASAPTSVTSTSSVTPAPAAASASSANSSPAASSSTPAPAQAPSRGPLKRNVLLKNAFAVLSTEDGDERATNQGRYNDIRSAIQARYRDTISTCEGVTAPVVSWLKEHRCCSLWFSVIIAACTCVVVGAAVFVLTKKQNVNDECVYKSTGQTCAYANCEECNPPRNESRKGGVSRHQPGAKQGSRQTSKEEQDSDDAIVKARKAQEEFSVDTGFRPVKSKVKKGFVVYGFADAAKLQQFRQAHGTDVAKGRNVDGTPEVHVVKGVSASDLEGYLKLGYKPMIANETYEKYKDQMRNMGVFTIHGNRGNYSNAIAHLIQSDKVKSLKPQEIHEILEDIRSGDVGPANQILDTLYKSRQITTDDWRWAESRYPLAPVSSNESALAGQPRQERIFPSNEIIGAVEIKIDGVWKPKPNGIATAMPGGIVTKLHAVESAEGLRFVPVGKNATAIEIDPTKFEDMGNDLVIYRVPVDKIKSIFGSVAKAVRVAKPTIGSPVYSYALVKESDGYVARDISGKVGKFTPNIKVQGSEETYDVYEHTMTTFAGYSGSPVFDHQGHLIGFHKAGGPDGGEYNYFRPVTANDVVVMNGTAPAKNILKLLNDAHETLNVRTGRSGSDSPRLASTSPSRN